MKRQGSREGVASRWQNVLETKETIALTRKTSFRSGSTCSINEDEDPPIVLRNTGGNISRLTAKFNSVDVATLDHVTSPVSPHDGQSIRRQWSVSSDTSSCEATDSGSGSRVKIISRNSVSKLTNKWEKDRNEEDVVSPSYKPKSPSYSRSYSSEKVSFHIVIKI